MPNHGEGDRQRPGWRACQASTAVTCAATLWFTAVLDEADKVRRTRHDDGMSDLILIAQCIGKATAAEADRNRDQRLPEVQQR